MFGKVAIVPGFRHRGVNPDDLFELLPKVNCTKGVFTPWMMECIARRPDAETFIRPFDHVAFGGGALPFPMIPASIRTINEKTEADEIN